MESYGSDHGRDAAATVAADQLSAAREMRQRVDGSGSSRASAILQLWGAIVIPVYAWVFLFSFGPRMSQLTVLLLFPLLLFSSLVSGARERFGIRTRPRGRQWIVQVAALAAFVGLLALRVGSVDYPWWLDLAVPAAMLVALAIHPIRQLERARVKDTAPWTSRPLSGPASFATVGIGVVSGLLVASSTLDWYPVASLVVMLGLLVALVAWRTSWGLPRTGFEWGPTHWVAFGVMMTTMFTLTALLSLTEWITTPVSLAAGILIAGIMSAVAFLPREERG